MSPSIPGSPSAVVKKYCSLRKAATREINHNEHRESQRTQRVTSVLAVPAVVIKNISQFKESSYERNKPQ